MASAAEIAEQRRVSARESAARAKSAGQSPLRSSGVGGWAGVGSDETKAAPAPGSVDGGLATGAIHSAEQEAAIRDKAQTGRVITNSDLGYMGHLANDAAAGQGHNIGMRAKGMAIDTTIARSGFRKLPGSAVPEMGSSSYDHTSGKEYVRKQLGAYRDPGAGNVKEIESGNGENGAADNSTAIGKVMPGPPKDVPADVAMSARHHRESIAFNSAHGREHLKEAEKHKKALTKMGRGK